MSVMESGSASFCGRKDALSSICRSRDSAALKAADGGAGEWELHVPAPIRSEYGSRACCCGLWSSCADASVSVSVPARLVASVGELVLVVVFVAAVSMLKVVALSLLQLLVVVLLVGGVSLPSRTLHGSLSECVLSCPGGSGVRAF